LIKVIDVNKLAEYSQKQDVLTAKDGGPVKTDLLKTTHFNVALICLESGQEIPSHPEQYGVCFYVINGRGVFTVGKEQFELAAGEMIFAQADEARGILSRERLTLLGIQDPH